jgi:hypothetical protein
MSSIAPVTLLCPRYCSDLRYLEEQDFFDHLQPSRMLLNKFFVLAAERGGWKGDYVVGERPPRAHWRQAH